MKNVTQSVINAINTVAGIDIVQFCLNENIYDSFLLDDYDVMDVAMELENEFDVSIDEGELASITTANQLVELVESKLS